MVTQFTARLHRWRCLFYSNLQLAWFARVVVSKFLASRIIAASVDLSRRLFCALELVCWSDCATQFPGFVAKFADCAFGCGRVGDARMDSRLALHVAAVQADVPQQEKFDPQFSPRIFERFSRLSEIALRTNPPPDLLIWPESSMPDPVRDPNTESNEFVTEFSMSSKTDLLLGTLDVEDRHVYNAALLISGGTQEMQVYRKVHLVPFGEYIPLRHSFPLFAAVASKWVPGDFDAGHVYTVFRLANSDAQVAPLICFEDTIGDLARQFVLRGANLLVDVTNDAWFLRSAGSRQHLANAIFRCVETRRPMARAANTGVTCFVNEFGRVTQMLQDE